MSQYLGDISAYALAVSQGYTGTEEEYAELMASYATVGQTAVTAAQTATTKASEAATSATTATNKATEATTAATTATTKAGEASTSASTATSAKDTAVSAASTATTKATEATTAAATATSAKTDAVAANTAAQSAKTAAQTAQTGAETAAASVEASAAQIATNTADISQLKSEFTALESDGAVPSAEQILTDKGVTDCVPYHYRKTGSNGADRLYDQIVGGTVRFNQLVQNIHETVTRNGVTATNNGDGSMTLSGTATAATAIELTGSFAWAKNHVYYLGKPLQFDLYNGYVAEGKNIVKTTNDITSYIYALISNGVTLNEKIYPQGIDLTAMFGTTIADYIYQLEQTTAGAGVAFFKALFPNDYYPYNAGELVSVSGLSEHKMVGKNLLAKPFVHYESVNVSLDECFFIKSGTYMFHFDSTNATSWRFLVRVMDGDGNLLTDSAYNPSSGLAYYSSVNGWLNQANITVKYIPITIAKDCYIRIMIASGDTSANTTVTGAQLEFGTTATAYKPYKAHSYPLDSTLTLRGVPKLVDGKMCFDGDTYDADGTVTRKYGVVDLGTLNWTKNTSVQNLFYCFRLPDMKVYANTTVADWMSSKYKTTNGNTLETTDKSIAMLNTNHIYVNDSAFTDATATEFKTAMSGVMLVYELTTPTTEEADPYQHLQQCDPNGTEEYVSTGIVPIGHNSFYPENLRAKVEQLPWSFTSLIAPTESAFVATRNYTTGSLFIVDNVLYKATSNIANGGTITPNTNCTATTLSEIISALA